jgi:hypothetical protein
MDAKLKRDWLALMRSGTIGKGTGFFKNGNHYCALGSLYYVLGIELKDRGYVSYTAADAALGRKLADKIWLKNDGEFAADRDFARIADWIEANVPESRPTNIDTLKALLATAPAAGKVEPQALEDA